LKQKVSSKKKTQEAPSTVEPVAKKIKLDENEASEENGEAEPVISQEKRFVSISVPFQCPYPQ
jgi:hypothetical protein